MADVGGGYGQLISYDDFQCQVPCGVFLSGDVLWWQGLWSLTYCIPWSHCVWG